MRAKTLLRLFARTPAWTAVRARDRVRALLLDLAWRARSNGANGALLRGRADEERKGDRWSRDARERARAQQLCKAHALSCAGRTSRKKARFIYYLLYHPRSRLRARARFHSLLSSYTNTQEQHSGPSCGSSGLRPAHFPLTLGGYHFCSTAANIHAICSRIWPQPALPMPPAFRCPRAGSQPAPGPGVGIACPP